MSEIATTGMVLADPKDCEELLRLCTVMGWHPKLPLHIMRDDMAARWFLKGEPGKQDYWIRDTDIDVLRLTPMWEKVKVAVPYGTAKAHHKAMTDWGDIIVDEHVRKTTGLDLVEQDRQDNAKWRLEAEEKLKKADDWE